jgi:hypothetical protein
MKAPRLILALIAGRLRPVRTDCPPSKYYRMPNAWELITRDGARMVDPHRLTIQSQPAARRRRKIRWTCQPWCLERSGC